MQFHLEQRRRWFHNWFFKWHQIGNDSAVDIDTFDGKTASFGNIEYSGSAVNTFWDSVVRGVQKEISEQFAWLDEQVRKYNPETVEAAIDECSGLITSFAEGVRRDAVEKDRVLRGRHGTLAATGTDAGYWEGTTRDEIASRANALKDALRPALKAQPALPPTGLHLAEKQVLAALVIEHQRPADRLLGHDEFAAEYLITAPAKWISAIIDDFGERGLVEVHRDKDGSSGILRAAGFKRALQSVIEDLGATIFEVDPGKERVSADADPYPGFPLPRGWDFITFDGKIENVTEAGRVRVDSASWTGPRSGSVLSENQRGRVLSAIGDAESRLQTLHFENNSVRSQVLALLGAAKDLTEVPEPPADIIWQLVGRAADVLGIAAFFATIFAALG